MAAKTGYLTDEHGGRVEIVDKNARDRIKALEDSQYELPQATSNALGGVKASLATSEENVQVRITSDGYLRVKAYQKPSTGIPAQDLADGIIPSDDHINSLIDTKLGAIENGTY